MPSLEIILETLTAADAAIRYHQATRQCCLDQLDQLVETGEAEEQMAWNDYKITRRIRKSYTYPEHINEQRDKLKAAERLSVALGEATLSVTNFWEVRQPKP